MSFVALDSVELFTVTVMTSPCSTRVSMPLRKAYPASSEMKDEASTGSNGLARNRSQRQ